MSTECALDENWVNIVVKNSRIFLLGIGIYQEKSAKPAAADALDHRITSSLVAMVLTK